MASSTKTNSGWALETSLDVEWAHAIAPQAKILLVEAKTESGANLLSGDRLRDGAKRRRLDFNELGWG